MLGTVTFYSSLLILYLFLVPAYCLDFTLSTIPPPQDSILIFADSTNHASPTANITVSKAGSEFIQKSKYNIYFSSHRMVCDEYYSDFNNYLNDYDANTEHPFDPVYDENWYIKELGFNIRYKDDLFIHLEVDYYNRAYSLKYYQYTDDNGEYFPEHTVHLKDNIIIPKVGLQHNFAESKDYALFIRGSLGYPIQNPYNQKQLSYERHTFQYSPFFPDVNIMAGGELEYDTFGIGLSFGYDLILMKYKNIFNQKRTNFGGEMIELYILDNLNSNTFRFKDVNSFKLKRYGLFFGFGSIDHESYNTHVEAINLANLPQDDSLHSVQHNPGTTGLWSYENLGFEYMLKTHLSFRLDAGDYRTVITFQDSYIVNEVTHDTRTRSEKYIILPALGMRYYYLSTSKFDVFSEVLAGFPTFISGQHTKDLDYTVSFPSFSSKASSGILYGNDWCKLEFAAAYLYMPMELITSQSSSRFNAGGFYFGYKLWVKF